jgi:hypothetical protein
MLQAITRLVRWSAVLVVGIAVAGPAVATDFAVINLSGVAGGVREHNSITGDDRGGIAASLTQVFYNGDTATGRFALGDLSGTSVGGRRDGLIGNLATGQVYALGNAAGLFECCGAATRLLALDGDTGALTGDEIGLSAPVTIGNETGIFAGWNRIVLVTGGTATAIDLPSGAVTALGPMAAFTHSFCETFGYWGIAEQVGPEIWISYVEDSQTIVRRRVPDGARRVIARFINLADLCAFTVVPSLNRWYFHHESTSQFRSGDETIGFAAATWTGAVGDTDGDGIVDPFDNCPAVANPAQTDTDGDATGDACDTCPGFGAADTDGDGRCDETDNCLNVANAGQADSDVDGIGDACDGCVGNGSADGDGDGRCDFADNCPTIPNPTQADSDFDGLGDACDTCFGAGTIDTDGDLQCDPDDNCPATPNPTQMDSDFDGIGDACDNCVGPGSDDADGDAICDVSDNCPLLMNPGQTDCDFDGLGDACDADTVDDDGDGVANLCDNCPLLANPDQGDRNGDAIGDACAVQGRPDSRGCYRAFDTLAPPDGNQPTYAFVDISSTGTQAGIGAHQVSNALPIGFDFSFYGATYSQVFISSNGFLSFLPGQGEGCCGEGAFPDPLAPNAIVTGLWGHYHPNFTSIRYQTLGSAPARRFVVQFTDVSNSNSGSLDTFEIILEEGSNEMLVQYASAVSGSFSSTIGGIENQTGSEGLRWAGPGDVSLVNQAVRYAPTAALTDDSDGDGFVDCRDTCPSAINPDQADSDGNGVGDLCNGAEDADGDEWADALDNCPSLPNPTQADATGNGIGDACGQGALDTAGCYRVSDTISPPDGTEPTYAFTDISTTGTVVPIGLHAASLAVPIGFPFSFYGQSFTQVFVSSNGFVTFLDEHDEGCCGAVPIPSPNTPNGLVTGVWAHLHPNLGDITSQTIGTSPNRRFIVQFTNAIDALSAELFTFQIVLHESSNEITVEYQRAVFTSNEFKAGIESPTGTEGFVWADGVFALIDQAVR